MHSHSTNTYKSSSANCYRVASEYTGTTSVTETGLQCQPWWSDTPHSHRYHDGSKFPDDNVREAVNYCRSPDGDAKLWCYTVDRKVRWQYCNVSKCPGNHGNRYFPVFLNPFEQTSLRLPDRKWSYCLFDTTPDFFSGRQSDS